jgi:hypothetical protein
MTSAKYSIYVSLKNGDQVGGRELYKGPPPASGTELEVPLLRGGTVKARIGSFHTEPGKRGGIAGTVVTATPSRLLLCRSSWADNARASH